MSISVPELSNRAVVAVPRSDRALGGGNSYSLPATTGLYRNFFKRALDIFAVLVTARTRMASVLTK